MTTERTTPKGPKRPSAEALACLGLFVALVLHAATASALDPHLDWHVVETPHFKLHFHTGEYQLAQRMGRALEAAHARLSPLLGHAADEKVLIVLQDDEDTANGFASAFLRPTIHFYADVPDDLSVLSYYEDYTWTLAVHEYTHILHLDRVGGIPSAINLIFGKVLTPNAYQPRWFLEGLAEYEESNLDNAEGRIHSNLFDMYLRADFLEKIPYRIDQTSNDPLRFPRGNAAYLYGGRFINYIAERYGEEALAGISGNYGARLIPWALNTTAEEELGRSYLDLYAEWSAALGRHFDDEVTRIRRVPVTQPTALTHSGEETGLARYGKDGRVYYADAAPWRHPALRSMAADGTDDREEVQVNGATSLSLAPDRRRIVFSQYEYSRQFNVYEDLWTYDLDTKELVQRTSGLRATEPDVSPDGARIVCVARLGAGVTELLLLDSEFNPLKVLYRPPDDGTRVYTPRFSPDGAKIVFSEHRPSGRDVRILDLATGAFRDVTQDAALDVEPVFDATGKTVYFSSDRDGIFNLYAFDVARGSLSRVTNIETGLFRPEPSPDGRWMVATSFSSRGFDVARFPIDAARWGPAPPPPPHPDVAYQPTHEVFPVAPYRAIDTLWPRYWLPVAGTDARGLVLGAVSGGQDIVGRHAWSAEAWWGIASSELGFEASYANQNFYPSLGISVGHSNEPIPGGPSGSIEQVTHVTATADVPIDSFERSHQLSFSYDYRYLDPELSAVVPPNGPTPFIPDRGAVATVAASWYYASAHIFPDSLSGENGFFFGLTVRSGRPEWGGTFTYAAVDATASGYLAMPWLKHHVLAAQLSAGTGTGDLGGRRVYSLGGPTIGDPLLGILLGNQVPPSALRGYAPGAFAGNSYALANVEYRFPITNVEWGPWTLPFYFRRLHGAVFGDSGDAADRLQFRDLKYSVGAELRAELELGYYMVTTFRLGYARGLSTDGINNVYVGLGSSF